MDIKQRLTGLSGNKSKYPLVSMLVCMGLIFASPFVTLYLNYLAFVICLYRLLRYDTSIFAVDYCILASVSYIFLSMGHVSLLAWLSIVAVIWYIFRNGVRLSATFVLLLVLFDYMLLRMQTAISDFVLCFSQVILLYVLFHDLERENVIRNSLAYIISVILSSCYAMLFRNASQLKTLIGSETVAYWGSSLSRFRGLFRDPNYYMTTVLIALALLIVLCLNRHITKLQFIILTPFLVVFGTLSYSKTFIIVLAVCVLLFLALLIKKKYYLPAFGSLLAIGLGGAVLANTLFAVTIYRITSSDSLYDLTTGRSALLLEYFEEITRSVQILFFGEGLSAEVLTRGTHNLYLEIVFYMGLVGLIFMLLYFGSCVRMVLRRFECEDRNPNGVLKYTVLIVFVLLFCSLQGLTFAITYVMLFLSVSAIIIRPKEGMGQ